MLAVSFSQQQAAPISARLFSRSCLHTLTSQVMSSRKVSIGQKRVYQSPFTSFISQRPFSSVSSTLLSSSSSPSSSSSSTSPTSSDASSPSVIPIRIAVVGSGPSAFYTVKYLLKDFSPSTHQLSVDMFEALPVPFGLVRYGVAPDHPEVKLVTNEFNQIMKTYGTPTTHTTTQHTFRFFGNVRVGQEKTVNNNTTQQTTTHVSLAELRSYYHGVVLSYGAEGERLIALQIADQLKQQTLQQPHTSPTPSKHGNLLSARQFVSWYNGHPDLSTLHQKAKIQLKEISTVVVIGQGNVSIDIARILLSPLDVLNKTDISTEAIEQLKQSSVKKVILLGRRGPVQSAFTIAELRELTTVQGVKVDISNQEVAAGENEESLKELNTNRPKKRKFDLIKSISTSHSSPETLNADKVIQFRFFLNPVSVKIDSDNNITHLICEKTRLSGPADKQEAIGTGEYETIETQLVLQSIGYQSQPMEGAPFDSRRCVIPSVSGRVVSSSASSPSQQTVSGLYVSGWLKRGPTGIIATNITDAKETATAMIEDIKAGVLTQTSTSPSNTLSRIFASATNKPTDSLPIVDLEGWNKIDEAELQRGKQTGKIREKFLYRQDMLNAAKN